MQSNIIEVPEQFRKIRHKVITPLVNEDNVEESFYRFWLENEINSEYAYLPVFWTDYYFRNGFGKNISELQKFLNDLPTNKKYFSIVQYDDGILNDVSHLNLHIFSSGGHGNTTIPLLEYNIKPIQKEKTIWIYFRGNHTHAIRETILSSPLKKYAGNFISDKIVHIDDYMNESSQATFILCPRGYGKTSFRFYEAFAVGSIPVYIYDELTLPYVDEINWNEIAVLIHHSDFDKLERILEKIDTKSMIEKGEIAYEKYFTFDAVNKYIHKKITE